MSNRSHNRSPSPSVFIRHPHCFVPLSGQNIPPPPNWKPPPLPSDADDVGDSSTKSIKSNQSSASIVSASGHLNVPGTSQKNSLDDTNLLKKESDSFSSVNSTKDKQISEPFAKDSCQLKVPTLTENGASGAEMKPKNYRNLTTSIDTTPKNDSNKKEYDVVDDIRTIDSDKPEELVHDVPVEDSCLSTDKTDILCELPTKEKCVEDKVSINDSFLNQNINKAEQRASALPTIENKMEELVDNCKNDGSSGTELDKRNAETPNNYVDANNTTSSENTITIEAKPVKEQKCTEKNRREEKQSSGSINISKLEDELDLLPIPDFPSLDSDQKLEVLPMPEFPVPESVRNTELQTDNEKDSLLSTNDVVDQDKLSKTLINQSKDKIGGLQTDRSRCKTNVKSMESNLENITSALKLSKNDSSAVESFSKDIPMNSTDNCSEEKYSINGSLRLNEDEHQKKNEDSQNIKNDMPTKNLSKRVEKHTAQESDKDEKSDLTRKASIRHRKVHDSRIEPTNDPRTRMSPDDTQGSMKPASLISRIKNRANSDRRNSLAKTLTRLEPFLLVASSPPEGIRSQRLAELGVTCVVHAATIVGDNNKTKGIITSRSDGIDIVNANLEDGGNNLETFEVFGDKIKEIKQKKGVALIISDESSPSISQREGTATALCAAFMVKYMGLTLESALSTINAKRPEIKPSPSYCFQLQEYEQHVIAKRRFQNSKLGYFVEKVFEFFDIGFLKGSGGLERNNNNIIEKVSHNWIQLTIYFLMTLLFFRFLIQFIMLNFREEEDEDERNRLPCS